MVNGLEVSDKNYGETSRNQFIGKYDRKVQVTSIAARTIANLCTSHCQRHIKIRKWKDLLSGGVLIDLGFPMLKAVKTLRQ